MKRILQCAVVLPADAVKRDLFKAGYFTSEDRSVWFLVRDLTGWVSRGKALRKPLKLSIGGLRKQLVPLTVLYYQPEFVLSA